MAGSNKTKLSFGGIALILLVLAANHFLDLGLWSKADAATAPADPATATAPTATGPSTTAPSAAAPTRAGPGFRSERALVSHFEKHGHEFGVATAAEYLALAQRLRDRPTGPRLIEEVRGDGVITRFDRDTGAFLAFNADRTIRTLFVPNDGERYFRRQLSRDD